MLVHLILDLQQAVPLPLLQLADRDDGPTADYLRNLFRSNFFSQHGILWSLCQAPLDCLIHILHGLIPIAQQVGQHKGQRVRQADEAECYKIEFMGFTQRFDSAYLAMANVRQQQGFTVSSHEPHVGCNADR